MNREPTNIYCKKCGKQMMFDDSDFEFPGCGQITYTCPDRRCECYCSDIIRYNKTIKREWYWDEDIQQTEYFNTSNLNGGEFD